jgi:hypothetical protein
MRESTWTKHEIAYEGDDGHQGNKQRGEGDHSVIRVLRPRAVGADGWQFGAEDEQRPERYDRQCRGVRHPAGQARRRPTAVTWRSRATGRGVHARRIIEAFLGRQRADVFSDSSSPA